MRYLKISAIVFLGTLFFIAGCENLPFFAPKKPVYTPPQQQAAAPEMEAPGTVIARANNMAVTLEELNEQVDSINKLADQQNRPQDKIDTREKKIAFLRNELIKQKLLYQEALNRGIEKKEEVRRAINNLKMSVVVAELIKDELTDVDVTSSEIQEYYNTNKEQFREAEERQVREVLLASEGEAKQVLSSYYGGTDLSDLAKQYSKAATAAGGGDLGYIKYDPNNKTHCKKFYDTAFSPSLEVGSVSGIFNCPEGWYIIKLEGKKEGKLRTASEMWDDIKNYLRFVKQQQKLESLVNRLTSNARISVDESKIY
ncbi:MAG: peptidyl-prolyl cis-trans isomerase [Candidatus Omnitrophica bacterium]|nr:peptidyl-prolyl cis-trans isomerase [Candidatus Omnitrophota bacterium]MDD5236323.1 peptidyl-prolyl cis-trans isomerase [Candidatus Omnitrophota bacterium]MDD5610812.1 peptidyl-prolyl cis-trans isomerase [Candidatus Omnitrophota bacterium]